MSLFPDEQLERNAVFSGDRLYRYTLERSWEKKPTIILFIMLNPSTADEVQDDPTNRRTMNFAKREGFGCTVTVNLFAFRATNPQDMLAADDPVGPLNDQYILSEAKRADMIIAAWGTHGTHLKRDRAVLRMLQNEGLLVHCLGVTKDGHPRHPLYLKKNAPVKEYT